jgi:hypothetical protein
MGNRFIHPQIHAAAIAGERANGLDKEELLEVNKMPMLLFEWSLMVSHRSKGPQNPQINSQ